MLWIVCYDVRDDKRRSHLVKLLEQRCQRVQYSVFECPIPEKELNQLEPRWLQTLNIPEDSLRIYALDDRNKQRTRVYGSPPPYEPPDFIII